jgi:lipid II:glycine glycyltransferase (peptidoglycan interpeptide bridge formation enzyme)
MTHFLQSPAWARFQEQLGRTVITDSGEGWRYLAVLETGTLNTRLYCPYGPEVSSPAALDAALDSLKRQAANHHVTFLRIEPTGTVTEADLQKRGLRRVTYLQLQPEHTQVIDLTPSEDEIVAQMHQNTRNLYRNYAKKGLAIKQSNSPADITILTSLLHGVASRNHITVHSDQYFKTQAEALMPNGDATLFYVEFEGKPIAASLVYDSDTTRYYAHAAADDSFRKLSAGTALLAYIIVDAKHRGLTSFDLYGIAPSDDPSHKWAGFTKFKKSFGGSPAAYAGAWELPLKPLQYFAYRLYQTIRR